MSIEMKDSKAEGPPVDLRKCLPDRLATIVLNLVDKAGEQIAVYPELVPVAFIGNTRGALICGLDFSSEEAKLCSVEAVRQTARSHEADFVLLVSESFMLEDDAAKDYMAHPGKYANVSEHPGAIDCVIFQLDTLAGNYTGRAVIETLPKGRRLGATEFLRADSSSGRLAGLLPRPPKSEMH